MFIRNKNLKKKRNASFNILTDLFDNMSDSTVEIVDNLPEVHKRCKKINPFKELPRDTLYRPGV